MAVITIAEELQYLTHYYSSLEVPQGTVQDCLLHAYAKYPQLYIFLNDNYAIESGRILLILNDEELLERQDLTRKLGEHDTLHIYYGVPTGASYGVEIVTFFEFAAEYALSSTTAAALAFAVDVVIQVVVILVLNAIMGALVDNVADPTSSIASESAAYTFDGVKNTTASGTPLGIVYGTHRVGGQIISLFTRHTDPLDQSTTDYTELLYQIGVSEGAIESISAVEVNKLPSGYYDGFYIIDEGMHLGTSDQGIMPDFNQVTTVGTINRKILHITPPTPPVPLNYITAPVPGVVEIYGRGLLLGPYVFVEYDDSVGEAPVYFDPYAS